MNLDTLLTQPLQKPQYADSIDFQYQGIEFHVYGVLHGLLGGTNGEYVDFINRTIQQAKGMKLAEKSMLKMYKGLDGELDDWLQMTHRDTFDLTLKLFTNPVAIAILLKTLFIEASRKKDKFNCTVARLQDIGGSPYFHLIDPMLRRRYAGFPHPQDYLMENYKRRKGQGELSAVAFPDPDWRWLSYIEKNVNIPYRSIHMIEAAVMHAQKKGVQEVSLFVGEIHNTDIAWYVSRPHLTKELESEIEQIKSSVLKMNRGMFRKKLGYLGSMALASMIPMIIILLGLQWV